MFLSHWLRWLLEFGAFAALYGCASSRHAGAAAGWDGAGSRGGGEGHPSLPLHARSGHDLGRAELLPPGAQAFDSGDISPGSHFRHTFPVPGTYRYVCLPHEKMGMAGEVIVKP